MLAPAWQKVAQGTDGAFSPGVPWSLTSATVDFQAAGVRPGHVVQLRKPPSVFKGAGEIFAVANATGSALTLRRIGMGAGLGAPPSPPVGLSGVEFLIATLDPQIDEASFELNRRFAIDPLWPGRTPAELRDARELRQACVLGVLARRYAAETRGEQGDFALKLRQAEAELSEALARLEVRWGPGTTDRPSSSIFSTRIVR
ncbi:hypothetical protein [Paludisphaera mucosa]|uniref:Uncharacterized protein n=1 Tax=Paludisphaera mucosa TaxID=3030827 RepID=A0ABT6FD50_9BACT|nr:hypothetical protein [Paludisphaera mucosa]MDG3005506.1 hypothetical protein [Paludisphaera mucosa]